MAHAPERLASLCCFLVLCLLAGVRAAPAAAQAIECGGSGGGVFDVRPGDGAEGVVLDASVIVRYLEPIDLDEFEASLDRDDVCDGELVCLFAAVPLAEGDGFEQVRVAGDVERLDANAVAFVPDAELRPRTEHFPLIARPGFDSESRAEFEFRTGRDVDAEPPRFDVASDDIRVAVSSVPLQCQAPAGSVRVGLAFAPASDDGDEGSVEYLLYITRGHDILEPELRARARNLASTINMSFVLGPEEGQVPLCVAIEVVDGVGKVASAEPELCFDPVQGNFFEPLCTVTRAGGGRQPRTARAYLVPLALMLGLACVRICGRARRLSRRVRPVREEQS